MHAPRSALMPALIFGLLAWAWPAQAPAQISEPDLKRAEAEVLERGNALRRSEGLAPTPANPALSAAARQFAAYMARTDRYSHQADGRQPAQRAQARGYDYCMVAENIAYQMNTAGFTTTALASGFAQGWFDSPGHRHNLLSPEAVDSGVAIAHSPGSGRYYAVQMFGRPAALSSRFEIGNHSLRGVQYRLGDKSYSLGPGVTRWHQQCTAQALRIELPGGIKELKPRDGARYRVETVGPGLQLLD